MGKIIKLIKKYREQISYLIVGGATTLFSWAVLFVCNELLGMKEIPFGGTVSMAISTVLSVIFAFFAGKLFVFTYGDWKAKTVAVQLAKFAGGRAVTIVLEIGSVWLFSDILKVNIYIVKLVDMVVVTIVNYLISKFFVFKKEKKGMSYIIRKTKTVDFSGADVAKIGYWGWGYTQFTPECEARLIYVEGRGLALRMDCREKNPRAVYKNFGDAVWNDSCMEFFFGAAKGEKYINLEMNANGAFLMGIGKDRYDRTSVSEIAALEPVESGRTEDGWYVSAFITEDTFVKAFGVSIGGLKELYGNFYKCGDETEYPHFGMWSEVKTEEPDFHQSSFFGKMEFEK